MPLASITAENATLDRDYGGGDPPSFTVHLYDDDPRVDGAELAGGGYTAKTIVNNTATFPPAVQGVKSATVDFGTATAVWETCRWWLLKRPDGTWQETCQLDEPFDAEAGNGVVVTLTITHDQEAL